RPPEIGQWPPRAHSWRSGLLHAGEPAAQSKTELPGPPGARRARVALSRPWPTQTLGERQRSRVSGSATPHSARLHPTRKALAEWLYRELLRKTPRRTTLLRILRMRR